MQYQLFRLGENARWKLLGAKQDWDYKITIVIVTERTLRHKQDLKEFLSKLMGNQCWAIESVA